MDFKEYIKELDQLYQVGNTTEHSFRGVLANYLKLLLPKFVITNEPRRIDCGAPDYVITFKNTPIAFLEAKDVNDGDLDGRKEHKEQFNRYKDSLNRIIFTDYLDFHLYLEGKFIDSVRIAETRGNRIVGIPENEKKFNEMIVGLATGGRQKITSSATLAKQMAAKAHLLADAVKTTIELDGEDSSSEVFGQLQAFREVLIHDLKVEEFADIYAQTIVYGMFTARLNDTTPEDFSRQEAAELIPRSNPFLRRIFQSIAVYDLDESIVWIVDDLVAMFTATDAEKIMSNYGSNKRHSDPIVHFYEEFLAEYDPKLRKSRGVWYTPAPVVKFIVKSVDEMLQKEFGLSRGLADDSTIKVDHIIEQSRDKRTIDGMKHEMIDIPRVQVLDPATGTGTFLAEVIQQIRDKFNGLEGLWPSYVEKSLIPRIHGFEILMASYTIAHLKLSYTLKETGYIGQTNQRLNVFLTNSLEEATPRANNLFAQWLSDEADAASKVKMETPVMICLGNPPYSISSQNSGEWITNLVADYKKNLNERNIQPLSDDYIKFIRLGQYYINKNGEGILAYISNNGFLDGIIHRQMRKSLLDEFDKIYILNLHGNNRRKETAPDGTPDENVFDIMQGVSINLFIKTGKKAKGALAALKYYDLYGKRENKYEHLDNYSYTNEQWIDVQPKFPYFFFVPKDFSAQKEYEKGFSISELFIKISTGIKFRKDNLFVHKNKEDVISMLNIMESNASNETIVTKLNIKENKDWSLLNKRMYFYNHLDSDIKMDLYRVFDTRYVFYPEKEKIQHIVLRGDHRYDMMNHIMAIPNLALLVSKQLSTFDFQHVFVTNKICDMCTLSAQSKETTYVAPLYYFDGEGALSNINQNIKENIEDCISAEVSNMDIFDYVYAVLYSPLYRRTYKELLKINFPRIPYPKNMKQFRDLVEKGAELRKLHLMEETGSWKSDVTFPVTGSNNIDSASFVNGKVFINDMQYFGGISDLAWNFFIGGYQPAQKWLKDRKGRTLDYQDILHYGHIIYALQKTDKIMAEIDMIGVI